MLIGTLFPSGYALVDSTVTSDELVAGQLSGGGASGLSPHAPIRKGATCEGLFLVQGRVLLAVSAEWIWGSRARNLTLPVGCDECVILPCGEHERSDYQRK